MTEIVGQVFAHGLIFLKKRLFFFNGILKKVCHIEYPQTSIINEYIELISNGYADFVRWNMRSVSRNLPETGPHAMEWQTLCFSIQDTPQASESGNNASVQGIPDKQTE
ncbi:MAG: hypothetical protein JRI36_13600 [Deltaproteobacteria bacterium]|nr:hypothetical protein [Deltaproteobacteria bacterium]